MRSVFSLWAAFVAANQLANGQTTHPALRGEALSTTTNSAECDSLLAPRQWVGNVTGMGDAQTVIFDWEASGKLPYDPSIDQWPYWARFNVTGINDAFEKHYYGVMVIRGLPDTDKCFLSATQQQIPNPYLTWVFYEGNVTAETTMALASTLRIEPWGNKTVCMHLNGSPELTTGSPVFTTAKKPVSTPSSHHHPSTSMPPVAEDVSLAVSVAVVTATVTLAAGIIVAYYKGYFDQPQNDESASNLSETLLPQAVSQSSQRLTAAEINAIPEVAYVEGAQGGANDVVAEVLLVTTEGMGPG